MTIAKVLVITAVKIDVQDAMDARVDVTGPVKVHVMTPAKDIVTRLAKVVAERFPQDNGNSSSNYKNICLLIHFEYE